MTGRRHATPFPGFQEMAERRRQLGGELAARRLAAGLSQTELAARMGTSQSAVARLEAGKGDVRISTVSRYAQALALQVEITLGERD